MVKDSKLTGQFFKNNNKMQNKQPTDNSQSNQRREWCELNATICERLEQTIKELQTAYRQRHGGAKKNDPDIDKELLKAVDQAITDGHWEDGMMFETSGKRLIDFREKVLQHIQSHDQAAVAEKQREEQANTVSQGQLEVFISLYVAGGDDINKWAPVLTSLEPNSIGRPIYRNEEDVKTLIRSKRFQSYDGYVSLIIDEAGVVVPRGSDFNSADRFGKPLLIVKPSAIRAGRIKKFVHGTGEYAFKNSKLIKIDE